MLKYSGNHKGWYSVGNKLGVVLCIQVTGHLYALQRNVLPLALGHHQVSNCASEETIQCSIHNKISLIA